MNENYYTPKVLKYIDRLSKLSEEEVERFRLFTRRKEERIVQRAGIDTSDPEWILYSLPEDVLLSLEFVTGDRMRALIADTMRRSAKKFGGPIYATMKGYYL